jgi:hypothetical protein
MTDAYMAITGTIAIMGCDSQLFDFDINLDIIKIAAKVTPSLVDIHLVVGKKVGHIPFGW